MKTKKKRKQKQNKTKQNKNKDKTNIKRMFFQGTTSESVKLYRWARSAKSTNILLTKMTKKWLIESRSTQLNILISQFFVVLKKRGSPSVLYF